MLKNILRPLDKNHRIFPRKLGKEQHRRCASVESLDIWRQILSKSNASHTAHSCAPRPPPFFRTKRKWETTAGADQISAGSAVSAAALPLRSASRA